MKTRIVKLYYCDFCKRRKFTIPAMEKHETGCGANPNRKCGMCRAREMVQVPLDALKRVIEPHIDEFQNLSPAGLALLREATNDCPACILSTIRQCELSSDFDWKKEREAWLKTGIELFNEENPPQR